MPLSFSCFALFGLRISEVTSDVRVASPPEVGVLMTTFLLTFLSSSWCPVVPHWRSGLTWVSLSPLKWLGSLFWCPNFSLMAPFGLCLWEQSQIWCVGIKKNQVWVQYSWFLSLSLWNCRCSCFVLELIFFFFWRCSYHPMKSLRFSWVMPVETTSNWLESR